MHSIERYGIVALLFLVVTVVAVLMWDGGKETGKKKPAAGLTPAAPLAVEPAPSGPADEDRRLSLHAESLPGPLQRRPTGPALSAGVTSVPPAGVGGAGEHAPADAGSAGAPLYDTPVVPAGPREESAREPVVGVVPAATGRNYTVQDGDTLSEIAQRELGSSRRWREIVAANPGLDPAKLRLGSKIRLPGAGGGAGRTLAEASAAEPKRGEPKSAAQKPAAGGKTWKVGQGESLWRIAEKSLGDGKRWREIAALNPRVNPDRLAAGTVLVLPASAPAAGRTTPAPKRKAAPTVVASSAGPERAARGGGRVK